MYCSMSVTIDAIVDIKRNEIFLFFYIYLSKKDDIITIVFISMIFIMSSSFAIKKASDVSKKKSIEYCFK